MKKFILLSLLIVLGLANTFAQTCASPTVITAPFSSGSVTTCGAGTGGAASQCSTSYGGTEDAVVYSYTPTTSGNITVNLTASATYGGVFFHTGGCAGACVGNATTGSGTTATTNFAVVAGTTYTIVVSTWASPACSPYTLTISAPAAPPAAPANDACSGAVALACGGGVVNGTTVSTVSETAPSGCASAFGVWYTFTGDGSSMTLTSVAGAGYDHEIDVFSGSCGALTNIVCKDGAGTAGTETYTFTTVAGTVYYVYVAHYSTSSTATGTFNIGLTSCVVPPVAPGNDNCSGAIALTPSASCNPTPYTTAGATSSNVTPSGSCTSNFGNPDDDVWFSFVAAGTIQTITFANTSGVTDIYFQVFSSSACSPAMTSILCSDTDSGGSVSGLTVGNTYYVKVYTYAAAASTTGTICIVTPTPAPACGVGNTPPNDNCTSATPLTNFNGYCGTTLSTYTVDANAAFCGSIDNNSWLSFTASTPTLDINWWITGGTSCSSGAQFQIFAGTCGALTSISTAPCINPTGGTGSLGSITATGLTVGATYYLMVDGYAGDICNYVFAAESGVALPIELIKFRGHADGTRNILNWETSQEVSSDYVWVEKSGDGINFQTASERIKTKGNASSPTNYFWADEKPAIGNNYYRLKNVDTDGRSQYSGIINVQRKSNKYQVANVFPNPTAGEINVSIESVREDEATATISNILGAQVLLQKLTLLSGINGFNFDIQALPQGAYYLTIINSNNEKTVVKLMKN